MTQPYTATAAASSGLPDTEARSSFSLVIGLYRDFQQIVDFRMPGVAVLGLDEPPPLGHGWGPSPAQLLGSALGACVAAALLRELHARHIDVLDLRTEVSGTIRADTLGVRHLANLSVRLSPVLARRSDADRMPEPEDLADRSMIADSIRTDLGIWIAITPAFGTVASEAGSAKPAVDLGAPRPRFAVPVAVP